MSENQIKGGSGPALAAHSKDASVPGQTPASNASTETGHPSGTPDAGNWSKQAQETANRIASSLSDAKDWTRGNVAGWGTQGGKRAADMVQAQPLMVLAITGAACLVIGMLLARR